MTLKWPFVNEIIVSASVGMQSAGARYIDLSHGCVVMKGPVLPRNSHPPIADVEGLYRILLLEIFACLSIKRFENSLVFLGFVANYSNSSFVFWIAFSLVFTLLTNVVVIRKIRLRSLR